MIAERRDEVGQQVGRDGEDDAEFERSGKRVASGLCDFPDLRGFLEYPLRLLDDAGAERCDGDLGFTPLEEARAQFVLELLDRDGKRRLAHETALRGAAKAAFVGDGDDVAKLVERHLWLAGALVQERRERMGELGMLEAIIDGRLE